MDFHTLYTVARQFQGTNPTVADILPFVKYKLDALTVQEVLNGTAKRLVSVTTAYVDSVSGEWVATGESLDTAVEAEVTRLEDAGFVVTERDAGGRAGDGGDYHSVGQYIRFGLPPLKALVVGRHTGEIPGIEIIEQRNVNFALDVKTVQQQLDELEAAAAERGCVLVFQNIPGIVAAALLRRSPLRVRAGVIISRQPAVRPASVSRTWDFEGDGWTEAEEIVAFVNSRAQVGGTEVTPYVAQVTVTVDPVIKFEFDHIEWF